MFKPYILVTDNGTIIAIKYIESIGIGKSPEDKVVDKLKDDIVFTVTTISGREYSISTRYQMEVFKKEGTSTVLSETHKSILEKWSHTFGSS